jgi:serine/threonine protein kinase
MPESDSTSRDRQLRQIVAEFEHRRDGDFPIGPKELIADHPDFADELNAHFRLEPGSASQASDVLDESHHETTSVGSASLSHDTGWVDETIAEDSQSSEMLARVAHDAPRTQFGRYRILRELGRGGMGAVYQAHDEQLDREVALKIPQFGTEMNADVLARFYREARSAAALRHPGICPVYDVGEIDGQHYITMAFIKGRPSANSQSPRRLRESVSLCGWFASWPGSGGGTQASGHPPRSQAG